MNAVLDIGNTNVRFGIFHNNKMIYYELVAVFSLDYLRDVFSHNLGIENLCISNTSSDIQNINIVCEEFSVKCITVNEKCKLPISTKYQTPKTLGSDRLALCVAASIAYPGDCLVIDIGTCITYDLLLDNIYYGGQITPGLTLRLLALHEHTANLPKIEFKVPKDFIGKTTSDSIAIGAYRGILAEINGIIEEYKLRYPGISVILTGGSMEVFINKIQNINFINHNLLMQGLNYIIASNE